MFGYIIIMLCVQACFVQDVRSNPLGVTGGHGHGNIAVGGKLGVSGRTCVSGSVPVCGAVEFGGKVPAAGCVTIAGKCSCGHH